MDASDAVMSDDVEADTCADDWSGVVVFVVSDEFVE